MRFSRVQSGFLGDRRGAGAVEFALVLPIIIVILFLLVEIGYYLWARNVVDHAARETSRYGMVRGPWGNKWAGTETAAQTLLATYAGTKLSEGGLDPAKGTTAATMNVADRTITVTVTYAYSPMLVPASALPDATLTAVSLLDIQQP